jgi:hypothetical protein
MTVLSHSWPIGGMNAYTKCRFGARTEQMLAWRIYIPTTHMWLMHLNKLQHNRMRSGFEGR